MLTRKDLLLRTSDDEVTRTMDLIYAGVAWAYPSIEDGDRQAFDEKFAMAEHIIGRYFKHSSAQEDEQATFSKLCEMLSFDQKDTELATQNAREDFGTDQPTLDEIAISAVFWWFAESARSNGDFNLEFKYLFYVLSESMRGNAELQKDGIRNLAEKLQGGDVFIKLASFYRDVLAHF